MPLTSTTTSPRILIVDDEPDILHLIEFNLARAGYRTRSAPDAEEALRELKATSFDLLILDRMLPGLQGTELCRIIRQNPKTAQLPIIMLTARGEVSDRIDGLDAGADDYLAKPFSPAELIARIKAILRRAGGAQAATGVLTIGDLRIDRTAFSVRRRDMPIHLSATEFRLLLYLAERRGRIFSREQLLSAVWNDDAVVDARTVDVHVRRLRSQIEDDPANPVYILTRRGVGYYVE